MKALFINKCFNFINKKKKLDNYNQIKIKYGLEVMYYFVTKTFVILLLSYLFHFLKEAIIFNIFYIPLRSFAHGFHAKNNVQCWIITIATYFLLYLYIKYIVLNIISVILLFTISIISFLIWAPADTKNLPLIRKSNRTKLKKASLFILIIEILLSFVCCKSYIYIAIILEVININPIIYKLFKAKYNNYIDYQ